MRYEHLIGAPFEIGARGPEKFDCYGLCLYLLREQGHTPPDYTSPSAYKQIGELIDQQRRSWVECGGNAPGSVIVFRLPWTMHCGLNLGGDKFIHAWEKSGGVCVERLSGWSRRIVGFYEYRA